MNNNAQSTSKQQQQPERDNRHRQAIELYQRQVYLDLLDMSPIAWRLYKRRDRELIEHILDQQINFNITPGQPDEVNEETQETNNETEATNDETEATNQETQAQNTPPTGNVDEEPPLLSQDLHQEPPAIPQHVDQEPPATTITSKIIANTYDDDTTYISADGTPIKITSVEAGVAYKSVNEKGEEVYKVVVDQN